MAAFLVSYSPWLQPVRIRRSCGLLLYYIPFRKVPHPAPDIGRKRVIRTAPTPKRAENGAVREALAVPAAAQHRITSFCMVPEAGVEPAPPHRLAWRGALPQHILSYSDIKKGVRPALRCRVRANAFKLGGRESLSDDASGDRPDQRQHRR